MPMLPRLLPLLLQHTIQPTPIEQTAYASIFPRDSPGLVCYNRPRARQGFNVISGDSKACTHSAEQSEQSAPVIDMFIARYDSEALFSPGPDADAGVKRQMRAA